MDKKNTSYFIEGLQGSGKSTLVQKLWEQNQDFSVFREGDYSPVELAWCAYLDQIQYSDILNKYAEIKEEIEAKTVREGEHYIICYTQIITDIPGFHKDLEQYEIYNARRTEDIFKNIVIERFRNWDGNKQIFECSIFQNIVEDMLLFTMASDDEIVRFYHQVKEVMVGKNYRIIYLKTENIRESIEVIKKERADEDGVELWFPMMCAYFEDSPYAKAKGESGLEGLLKHLSHRQELELRICKEVFPKNAEIWVSKSLRRITEMRR